MFSQAPPFILCIAICINPESISIPTAEILTGIHLLQFGNRLGVAFCSICLPFFFFAATERLFSSAMQFHFRTEKLDPQVFAANRLND